MSIPYKNLGKTNLMGDTLSSDLRDGRFTRTVTENLSWHFIAAIGNSK